MVFQGFAGQAQLARALLLQLLFEGRGPGGGGETGQGENKAIDFHDCSLAVADGDGTMRRPGR